MLISTFFRVLIIFIRSALQHPTHVDRIQYDSHSSEKAQLLPQFSNLYSYLLLISCNCCYRFMASEDDDVLALLSEPDESDELVDLSNSFSALLSAATGSDDKTLQLSPEEAAWVDSCLVFDAELSDDNWITFTEALLDTLNYETDYADETLQGRSAPMTERSETEAMYVEERDEDADAEDEAEAAAALIRDEERDKDTGEGNANAEDKEEAEQEAESHESIFKVWDLETLNSNEDEDDELIKQLNMLLIGGSDPEGAFQQLPYEPSMTVIQEEIINDLAASMTDLSLHPFDD